MANRANDDRLQQARHSREGSPEVLARKRTEPMLFVLWRVFASWTGLRRLFPGKKEDQWADIHVAALAKDFLFQAYGRAPAFVLAFRPSICPRGRFCGADQQISRRVLQSLGGRLLAIGPVRPGWRATSRSAEQGLW